VERGPEPGGIDRAAWERALQAVRTAPVPASDAVTTMEFATLMKLSREQAAKRLHQMVEAGLAERTRKVIRRNDGAPITCPAYRLVKGQA